MKRIYTVTKFDTKSKRLTLVVRGTEQEAKEQIEWEINLLKGSVNVLESKMDYSPDERISLGSNEHNGYCRTEDTEYFWKTDCIVETVFTIE